MTTKTKTGKQEVVEAKALVANQVQALANNDEKKREQLAVRNYNNGWGLPADPRAAKALCALTAYYGLDPVMGDIIILGGKVLYICEQAYKKKLEEKAMTLNGGKPYRWRKRPATKEEMESMGYGEIDAARGWFVELLPPEGMGDGPITTAFGEADKFNCQLQNISKQVGDPRILNRMAIKRAEHECMRDVVTFRLPSPKEFTQLMGMAMEDMLKSGVSVMVDDGLLNPGEIAASMLPESPRPEDVTGGKVKDNDDNREPSENTAVEAEPTLARVSDDSDQVDDCDDDCDDDSVI